MSGPRITVPAEGVIVSESEHGTIVVDADGLHVLPPGTPYTPKLAKNVFGASAPPERPRAAAREADCGAQDAPKTRRGRPVVLVLGPGGRCVCGAQGSLETPLGVFCSLECARRAT